jgi:uncharacterized membrane protein YfcA
LITDPLFYATAIPAVLIVGMAKGGFGGPVALMGVPLMSLVISPVQAAGILLPILVLMDMAGLYAYRGTYHWPSLRLLLPAGVVGIGIGYLTAAYVTDAHVRLIVGTIAVVFTLNHWFGAQIRKALAMDVRSGTQQTSRPSAGLFWGAVGGFTSFVSHAGGPPFQMYMLPQRLDPKLLAGTAVIYFTVVNQVKLIPYYALGQFSGENLSTSAVLFPLALAAVALGVYLTRRVDPALFYRVMYVAVFAVALKLIWDGVAGLAAG